MSITKLFWHEIKDAFAKKAPQLAEEINALMPSKDMFIYKASYAFGEIIVHNGQFRLPNNAPLAKYDCDYSPIPLCLTWQKQCELFVQNHKRPIPFFMFDEGALFGVYEVLDFLLETPRKPKWCITAGARTIGFLPKIQDLTSYRHLSASFPEVINYIPEKPDSMWDLCRYLAKESGCDWRAEILIFPKNWFSKKWLPQQTKLLTLLFKKAWISHNISTEAFYNTVDTERIQDALLSKRIKLSDHMENLVQHLIRMMHQRVSGFRPATTNDAAPVTTLQKILINDYQLKEYYPTFVSIWPISAIKQLPVYYSFGYPTITYGNADSFNTIPSIASLLKNLNLILQTIAERAGKHIFANADYRIIHPAFQPSHHFIPSANMIDFDPAFKHGADKFPSRRFCASSSFWKGCVGIFPETYSPMPKINETACRQALKEKMV